MFSSLARPEAVQKDPVCQEGLPQVSLLQQVHCTVYSVQCTVFRVHSTVYTVKCTVYNVQSTVYSIKCTVKECSSVCGGSPSVPYFGEWNLSPGSCFASPLQSRWFQLSDKVVPIGRQGDSNCLTRLTLSDNLNHFFSKIMGGPTSPTRWFYFSE